MTAAEGKKRKVLIVSFAFPPTNSIAAVRASKFAKYLPEFGWHPIILTVESGQFSATDTTYLEDIPALAKIYKTKSIEPHTGYKKLTGIKSNEVPEAALDERNVD